MGIGTKWKSDQGTVDALVRACCLIRDARDVGQEEGYTPDGVWNEPVGTPLRDDYEANKARLATILVEAATAIGRAMGLSADDLEWHMDVLRAEGPCPLLGYPPSTIPDEHRAEWTAFVERQKGRR